MTNINQMTNQTQKEWIVEQLNKNGFITRNQCLRNFISRLGAIIWELKNEDGFEFDSFYQKNTTPFGTDKDFVYKWTNPKNADIKTEFVFQWVDDMNTETPLKVSAKTFGEACDIFLTQPPIFMFAVNEEVEDNIGNVHNVETNPKFREFRTYSKPKKRTKNEN